MTRSFSHDYLLVTQSLYLEERHLFVLFLESFYIIMMTLYVHCIIAWILDSLYLADHSILIEFFFQCSQLIPLYKCALFYLIKPQMIKLVQALLWKTIFQWITLHSIYRHTCKKNGISGSTGGCICNWWRVSNWPHGGCILLSPMCWEEE